MLQPFTTIGKEELAAAEEVLTSGRPLSGYLGGIPRGGYYVEKLQTEWQEKFEVKHAVACNSATSGLLAACVAAGVSHRTTVTVPAYTMSATAAVPKHLGAILRFSDIDAAYYGIKPSLDDYSRSSVVIATNLFGHPADLHELRRRCDNVISTLIEDNAQAPFALDRGKYTGTIGHAGVFSLNIHKCIQAGEGGIICTDSEIIADRCRGFINHGELASGARQVGLNLRMTEFTAAIASVQLRKGKSIVASRIEQAEFLTECAKSVGLSGPAVRSGCVHAYYIWSTTLDRASGVFVREMYKHGLPVRQGYIDPLHRMPAFPTGIMLPVTDSTEGKIVTFENCGWTITDREAVKDAFGRSMDAVHKATSEAFS